ncbi:MAG: hypothetical protein CXZ00_04485 [Acidobacteria bacterium]|nr:MAG: hypothetical protein CXZ00_04485 [Acidobacteriota bacterium]
MPGVEKEYRSWRQGQRQEQEQKTHVSQKMANMGHPPAPPVSFQMGTQSVSTIEHGGYGGEQRERRGKV